MQNILAFEIILIQPNLSKLNLLTTKAANDNLYISSPVNKNVLPSITEAILTINLAIYITH